MNYRLISKDLLLKLTNKEAYTFCCLLLNTKLDTYISHIKEKTLTEMTGYSERTISTYIQKFKSIGLLVIKTEQIKGEKGIFNRNTYHVIKPTTNFYRVEYDFLLEEIPSDIKGYLLLLKCIGYQGSNSILYSLDVIGKKKLFQIGLSTIKKLNTEAISLCVVSRENTGYRITDRFIYEDVKREKIPSDSQYQDYYNQIVDYCIKRQIIPPKYDRYLMYVIYTNCPEPSFFINKMENRMFTEKRINSLEYFIRVLGFRHPAKKETQEYIIIM